MLTNLPGYQEMRLSQDINNLYKRIYNRIPSSHKNKVLLAVKSYEERISSVDTGHDYYLLAERTIQNFFPTTASSIDMSQAVFVVLVKATNDMDDDIRAIMDEIKKMTAAKQKLRDKTKELNSWISEEMSDTPDSEDIENEPVSSKETDKRPYLNRTKIDPKMRITHNYKVKFYETPVIKPNPNLNKMPLNELKKRLQQSNEELRILINVDNATRSALRPLSEKRNKLIQIVLNLSKKV
jgi:hypothetical protein